MLKNYKSDRCYIIAEIGGNFTEFDQAKRLIDEAHHCNVDAVKIQTYRAENISSRNIYFNFESTGEISQFDYFKKYEIDEKMHGDIFEYIKDKNMDWFSTPSHEIDVDMLENFGVGAYKIGSDDAVNIPFLKYVAKKGQPIFLSTGMCTMEEVRQSVEAILKEGNDKITLLHTVTSYPARPENVNLTAIQSMIRDFPFLTVGYSDHTIGTTACICAAVIGAKVIEKHFTYDKNEEGPDHLVSADPPEMRDIVNKIREYEVMKGNGIKRPADCEISTREDVRKSVVVAKPLKTGEIITRDHLAIKRPGRGIAPKYLERLIGQRVFRDLNIDDVLTWGDF